MQVGKATVDLRAVAAKREDEVVGSQDDPCGAEAISQMQNPAIDIEQVTAKEQDPQALGSQ